MAPTGEQAIFLEALDRDPAERAAFLDEACAGDAALRRGVETLLRLHEGPHRFLNVPVVEQLAAASPEPAEDAADLAFLAPSSEPGSLGRLDHYEVLEVVGRGGMGIVLRARDIKLLRIVAIKVLAASLAASGAARRRFAREACAAAAVRDDHVVAIHAVCDDAPVPYLVMEFIDGCNLETLIRRAGPLELKEILRIGIQTASGLAAAHRQGLIHRDIKPANILLENGVQRVRLTDFGLARAVDDASLTQSGFIAGTPLYMSPEQAAGEPIGPRADLFSLGSVLYELCTGRPAFRASNTLAVIRRVSDQSPRPIREVNPDIPEPLCQLIERLHAKKPADRPASAQDVAESLARLLAGLEGQDSGVSSAIGAPRPSPSTRFVLSPSWAWAAALVLLVAGLGLAEGTGVTEVGRTVIHLFSPKGTLVVDVEDPGVSVSLDGAEISITGAGVKEIRLKPGHYSIQASRDGKLVSRELVTITRNGRRVVRIREETAPPSDAGTWERSLAGLPADQQVEAFRSRMRELNPGFDGKVTPTVEDGVVKGLQFIADKVIDLSPVRAFPELQSLDCAGPFPAKGPLSDLSPLRGLRLKSLNCSSTLVSDLGPLRGMPLTLLDCGMTPVSDLSPLKGIRLEVLMAQVTQIADLAPLEGMPLQWLDLAFSSGVSDLSPLRGMPLAYLNVTGAEANDLGPLSSSKQLRILILDESRVTDLLPVRHLRLERISLLRSAISDLSPIEGMPLKQLRLDYGPERERFLRSFQGLEFINDKPAIEFWKGVSGKSG